MKGAGGLIGGSRPQTDKHLCRQVPLLVNFKKSRHLGFGVLFGPWVETHYAGEMELGSAPAGLRAALCAAQAAAVDEESVGPAGKSSPVCTDKNEKKIFLIYKEIQMGSGAKSYGTNGILIYGYVAEAYTTQPNSKACSRVLYVYLACMAG